MVLYAVCHNATDCYIDCHSENRLVHLRFFMRNHCLAISLFDVSRSLDYQLQIDEVLHILH